MKFAKSLVLVTLLFSKLFSTDYVVGDLKGQLGNQMFIIAATESLARDNNAKAVFPGFHEKNQCSLQENRKKIFFRLDDTRPKKPVEWTYSEPYFHYAKIPYRKNMAISGYFQSEKYFAHHKQEIIELFAPSDEILSALKKKYGKIITHPNTVSIHFRDYIRDDPDRKFHPNCTTKYYKNAISMFSSDSLFVVFSNDIPWCKKHFRSINRKFVFIEKEHFHHDFFLMSMCKDHIISNSSFSWWAAYLNKNPKKNVVAPRRWFFESFMSDWHDIYPKEWFIVDV